MNDLLRLLSSKSADDRIGRRMFTMELLGSKEMYERRHFHIDVRDINPVRVIQEHDHKDI